MNNFMSLLDPFHSSTKCRFFAHSAALIQERRKVGKRAEGGEATWYGTKSFTDLMNYLHN